MAVAIPFFIANLLVFSAEVGIEGKTANKNAAKKADKWNRWGSSGGSIRVDKKKKHPKTGVLAQRRGFAPLAARPAPTLSTSSFAVGLTVIQLPQGKAFCSRKTAPTLESSSIPVPHTNKKTPTMGCFLVGAEKRIRTSGTFQAHTRFPKAQNREKGARKPDFKQKTARNGGFLFLQRGSNRG